MEDVTDNNHLQVSIPQIEGEKLMNAKNKVAAHL